MKNLIAFLLALAASGAVSSAAPIVSYSFPTPPYTAGSNLNGQQSWSGSTFINVDATGLTSASMLGETGGSIRGVTSFTNVGAGIVTAPTVGTDSNTGTGSYYFAALLSMNDTTSDGNYLRFTLDSAGGTPFTFGLLDNQFVVNGSAAGFSGTQYAGGSTALIVGKMTVTGVLGATNETFDFWLNPTNATSDATLTSTAQGTILGKGINVIFGDWGSVTVAADMSGSATNNRYIDEIRVGASLNDLNLVPEPSTVGLLIGAGALALGFLRRRRV